MAASRRPFVSFEENGNSGYVVLENAFVSFVDIKSCWWENVREETGK